MPKGARRIPLELSAGLGREIPITLSVRMSVRHPLRVPKCTPRVTVNVTLVDQRVTSASGYEPTIDWKSCSSSDDERNDETAPEQEGGEAGIHCARYENHNNVVDDLHNGNRDSVRGKGKRQGRPDFHASSQQGKNCHEVAKHEGKYGCEHERGRHAQPEK